MRYKLIRLLSPVAAAVIISMNQAYAVNDNTVRAYYADEHNVGPNNPSGNRILEMDLESMTLVNSLYVDGLSNHHADNSFRSKVYSVPKESGFITAIELSRDGSYNTSLTEGKRIDLTHKPRSGDAYNADYGVILMAAANRPMGSLIDVNTDEVVATIGENVDCVLTTGGRLNNQPNHNSIANATRDHCVITDYGGTQVSGHPYWLNNQTAAIVDRTNRQITTYRVLKNGDGTYNVTPLNNVATRSSIHQIVPRDRSNLPSSERNFYYAIEEGNAATYTPPSLLKLELLGTGLRLIQRIELGRANNNLSASLQGNQAAVAGQIAQACANIASMPLSSRSLRQNGGNNTTTTTTTTTPTGGGSTDGGGSTPTGGGTDGGGTDGGGTPCDDDSSSTSQTRQNGGNNTTTTTTTTTPTTGGSTGGGTGGSTCGTGGGGDNTPTGGSGGSTSGSRLDYATSQLSDYGITPFLNQNANDILIPAECIDASTQGGHNADFDFDLQHLYIGSEEGNVFIVDVFQMQIVSIVSTGAGYGTGAGSGHTTFVPGKNLAIVTNHNAPYHTAINTKTRTRIRDIPLNFQRENIFTAVQSHTGYASDDGQYYYNFWTDGGTYYKINTTTLQVVNSVYTGGIPIQGSYIKLGNLNVDGSGSNSGGGSSGATNGNTLVDSVTQSGSVGEQQWQYFSIQAGSDVSSVRFDVTGLSADGDLYVRAGSKPSGHQDDGGVFDCKSVSSGTNNEQCAVSNQGTTTWYAGVYGFAATNFTIKAKLTMDSTSTGSGSSSGSGSSLNSGQMIQGSVGNRVWKYYTIQADANDTQLIVNLTDLSADADLYVRANTQPTSASGGYDCRSEHSQQSNEACTLQNSGTTTWHIGVYGFAAASYSLTARLQQNGSSGSGSSGSGSGGSPSSTTTSLTLNSSKSATVGEASWMYYSVDVPTTSSQLTVTLDKLSADIDLYVRENEMPSGHSDSGGVYDCGSYVSGTNTESCVMNGAGGRRYIIGVYGYHAGNYRILATTNSATTSAVQSLSNGDETNGSVGLKSWDFYKVSVPADQKQLKVILSGMNADGDLFVRQGEVPSGNPDNGANSDCLSDDGGTSVETCVVNNTGATDWYIGVFGYKATSYNLTVTTASYEADPVTKSRSVGKGEAKSSGGSTNSNNAVSSGGGGAPSVLILALLGLISVVRRKS